MTFFHSSSAAVSSEKNLEQNILLLKDIPVVRGDLPFACLQVGTLLPINALMVIKGANSRIVGKPEVTQDWPSKPTQYSTVRYLDMANA
jgi:hypothetical protein